MIPLAVWTCPCSVAQRQRVIHMSAAVTRLSARIPAVDERNVLITFARNLFHDRQELTEGEVGYLPPPQSFHGGDVQILEEVPVKGFHKAARQFPKVVLALTCNLAMHAGKFTFASSPIVAAELAAGQTTIRACNVVQGTPEEFG